MSAAHAYCPFYCEENVWKLAGEARFTDQEAEVWLVSNAARQVAMWGQKASTPEHDPVIWDYHLVLAARSAPSEAWKVWDLDSRDGLPLPASLWLARSFAPGVPETFAPRFRIFRAQAYRRELDSDRSHMKDPQGQWRAPPPAWPCIRNKGGQGPLGLLRDTPESEWLDLQTLRLRLSL